MNCIFEHIKVLKPKNFKRNDLLKIYEIEINDRFCIILSEDYLPLKKGNIINYLGKKYIFMKQHRLNGDFGICRKTVLTENL